MARNVAPKLIADHLVEGEMRPGVEVGVHVDQTLTQDATGTVVMLELEVIGLDRVRTELSAQYVIDGTYAERARQAGHHFVVGGWNYGQGSSREHAAIVPRFSGFGPSWRGASPGSIGRTS